PPKLAPDFELVVWLRGAYRNLGIGRECLGGLLADIRRGLPPQRGRHLRVRFPGMARPGSGKRMQKEMWIRFFSQYGLHRNVYPRAASPEDLVLGGEFYPAEDEAARG